jgi:HAD superfamily hydrolase (TIGR01509 family)
MLKNVIFDFDGVIVNSEIIHFEIEKKLFSELGAEISEEEYFEFAGISEKKTYDHFINKYSLDVTFHKLLDLKIKGFLSYLSETKELPVVEGVQKLIENLHSDGIILTIGTSGTRQIAEATLDKLGILKYFKLLVTGSEVPKAKPDPEIFLKILEETNSSPMDTIVIEDTFNGIEAACRAGLKVVGYVNPSSGNQDLNKADLIVERICDLNLEILGDVLKNTADQG